MNLLLSLTLSAQAPYFTPLSANLADDLDDIHICECKQMTAELSELTDGTAQMSKDWIESRIVRMVNGSKQSIANLGLLLQEVILRRQANYTKSLLGVHKDQKSICVVRLQ
ncbi:hypothetical protein F5984_18950 [Rudanella paleaurantiibacter]|uniref:Uncharacterized protein n=1 Tax=Rudanella paleaurantiibacter TaxID=2614655 RepID=A0A7J5TY06_9BACT|nr:hypothetical protein [Rudanella paleaurantiibacter]KAB7728451.1 hypothetical protein F5984_18950 [Rudanella paleaurantiibacter]